MRLEHELTHLAQTGTVGMSEVKWLQIARSDLGIEEIAGPKANPRIMQYYRAAGANWAKDDAVPWCGAAMAAWVSSAGYPVPAEAARARAWLDWGTPLEQPRKGAVAILKRGSDPNAGHVCLYLEDRGDRILVIGGNQGDAVSITSFPKRDVLGYRWPTGVDVPVRDLPEGVYVVDVADNAKPLAQSKTIGWTLAGLSAAFVQFFNDVAATLVEWAAHVAAFSPVKTAMLELGANVKAVGLGLGVSAGVGVISERTKKAIAARAAQEGKAG